MPMCVGETNTITITQATRVSYGGEKARNRTRLGLALSSQVWGLRFRVLGFAAPATATPTVAATTTATLTAATTAATLMLVFSINPIGASGIDPGRKPGDQPIHNTLLREGPSP